MWVDVSKKNMSDIEPWDRASITSIAHYVDEMSKPKQKITGNEQTTNL